LIRGSMLKKIGIAGGKVKPEGFLASSAGGRFLA
jgi:hypothetical protein